MTTGNASNNSKIRFVFDLDKSSRVEQPRRGLFDVGLGKYGRDREPYSVSYVVDKYVGKGWVRIVY
jgi:hypothetical protein